MAGQCAEYPQQPCRVNLDLMPDGTALWMYVLTGLAFAVFCYGVWQMVHVWRQGRDWKPGPWAQGLRRLAVALVTHRKFMQDRRPGTMHAWIFAGFVALFIGTTLVAIDADLFEHFLKRKMLFGRPYLAFEFLLDLFGILFLLGVGYAIWRRSVERPPQLHPSRHPEAPPKARARGDLYALWLLLGIGVTGFLLEGLRLRYQVVEDGIAYAPWSFAGNAVAAAYPDWSAGRMLQVYPVIWWTHFALWTSVLAVLPWTKFKHIITSSLNIYFHDPARQSRPELPAPFKLEEVLASGAADVPPVGYTTIRDLTWKHRLSLDACTNCGRCETQCPATAAGRPLSPRKLIQDLKHHMWEDHYAGRAAARAGKEHAPLRIIAQPGMEAQIEDVTLWSCTTCRACVTACPVDIEHVDIFMEIRRGIVMESRLDEHQQRLLVNITNAGNPYGFPAVDRADWRKGLPPGVVAETVAEKAARGASFEVLWWVGCSGSYDPRNQQVTRAIATLLNAAGVDFAILGPEERCTADPARRLGEEGRFQQSALENLATLSQHGVKRVITQCPHCFNAIGKEYPEFGAAPEVVHHTVLLERLLAEGKLPLKEGKPLKVTYHDSCYLMRHNGIADAPRNVLRRANNGLPVLEMAQSREQGLCCGAGGANMWFEVKQERERINVIRVKQAVETGADTVATACPFCLTMVSDGIGLTGNEGSMQARDLAEIVLDHLDWTPPAPAQTETPAEAPTGPSMGWSG